MLQAIRFECNRWSAYTFVSAFLEIPGMATPESGMLARYFVLLSSSELFFSTYPAEMVAAAAVAAGGMVSDTSPDGNALLIRAVVKPTC